MRAVKKAPLLLERPEIRSKILKAIENGATYKLAAQYAGIDEATLHRARAKGRAGVEPYAAFVQELDIAEGRGVDELLDIIKSAARGTDQHPGQWQAAAWILERRHGYIRTEKREVEAHITTEETTDADLDQRIEEIRASIATH